eukprot:Pompholyxophrys_sp_v1_NODE_28_length_3713_cov_6.285128.p2 type:complete len:301 gc:universal NODE_28_length_3713_cov_6.285128:3379-2477(-)
MKILFVGEEYFFSSSKTNLHEDTVFAFGRFLVMSKVKLSMAKQTFNPPLGTLYYIFFLFFLISLSFVIVSMVFKKRKILKGTALMQETIFFRQTTPEVKLFAVYAVEYLGYPQKLIANIFVRSPKTISDWIQRYRETGEITRQSNQLKETKIGPEPKSWVLNYVHNNPCSHLHEISKEFRKFYSFYDSDSTIYTILKEANLTLRVLEARALEISWTDICRFTIEINSVRPFPDQLLFLDEFSTDNRAMFRKKGWFLRGERPFFRSCFRRGKRVSQLAFLGVEGFVAVGGTEGTFNRLNFF